VAIPYTATQLNNGVVSASVLASYTAAEWALWAQSSSANNFGALSAGVVLSRISATVLNTLATTVVSGFNPLVVQQRTVMAITSAQFNVWLGSGPVAVATNHFLNLSAATLNALERSAGAPLAATVLALDSTADGKYSNLWVQWWNTNSGQRDLLFPTLFASVFTAARLSRMVAVGVGEWHFTAWLNSASNQLADLTATGLNNLAQGSPSALGSAAMTTARFQSWMARSAQAGFGVSNNLRYLTPAAINALARSAGAPLSASLLNAAKFSEWFSALGNLADMGAVTLNALARNDDRLLSIGFIGQSQFNGWLGNPNNRFTELTAQAINEMSSVFTAASTPASLSALATLMGTTDVLWDLWWTTRRSERASLEPTIFAAVFHPARLNAMVARDQRAVTQAQFADWLTRGASRLAALSANTLNELAQSTGAALASTALNQAMFNAWVLAEGGARLTSLTAATLNALAQNPNPLLSADGINPSRFAAWLQGGGSTTSVGRFASLTSATINALALNPQAPLSTTALEAGRFTDWLGTANNQNLRLLSAAALEALARNPGALLSSGGLTQAKFAAWLDANPSATSGFASLAAATLNALAANANLVLQASPLAAPSSSLWSAWWGAHAHDRATLGAATFAIAMTATRLNALSPGQLASVTRAQAVAWLLAPSNTLADLSATVINAWAPSAQGMLMAPELTQSMFGAWVARTESGQSRLGQLSADTLNALAANPNRLLGSAALGASQLNTWLLAQPFVQLSAAALNMLAGALTVPANSTGLTSLTDLSNSGSDARWTDWWSAHASDRSALAPDLFARGFGNTRLNRLAVQDLGAVGAAQFAAWLGRPGNSFSVLQVSTLNGLAPTVLATVTPAQFTAWLQVDASPQGGLNMGRAFNRLTAATINALAGNPGALQAVNADTLLSWCLTDRTRFTGLSALALNAMAGAVGIAAGRGLGPWFAWWRARAADRGALDPALFANYSIFGNLSLDQMDAQDLSGVAPAQLRQWLAQNQLRDLSAATFNALMPQWSDPAVAAVLAQSPGRFGAWWSWRSTEADTLAPAAFARWFGVDVLNDVGGSAHIRGASTQQAAAWLARQENRFADLRFNGVNLLLADAQSAALLPRSTLLQWLGVAGNSFSSLNQQVRFNLGAAGLLVPPPLAVELGAGHQIDGRFIVNSNQIVLRNLDFGATWWYSFDGGARWYAGVGNQLVIPPQDGRYTLHIRETNFAFVEAAMELQLVLDQAAPGAPTLVLAQDTGSRTDDGLTSNGVVRIAGLENDAHWEYSQDQGASWQAGSGTQWVAQVQGLQTIQVRQIDAAGNISSNQSLQLTLDNVAAAPPLLRLANDSGDSATDGITSAGTVLVEALEPGSTWQYSLDDGQSWSASRVADATQAQFVVATDGSYQIRVRQTDAAGNIATSARLPLTLVRTAPATVQAVLAQDTGVSTSDGLTQVGTVRFAFSGVAPVDGTVVQYRLNQDTQWHTLAGAVLDLPSDGVHTVYARTLDRAGNVSEPTAMRVELDRSAAAPTLTLRSDTGVSSSDLVTSVGDVMVAGLERGASWEFSQDGGQHWTTGSAAAQITSNVAGVQTVLARQRDAAGNLSEAASLTFTVQQTTPAAPSLALFHDTGSSGVDRLTSDGTVLVTGLQAGAICQFSLDGGQTWQSTGMVEGRPGFVVQTQGRHRAVVRQIDQAGNIGLVSGVLEFEVDTAAPQFSLDIHPRTIFSGQSAFTTVNLLTANQLLPTDVVQWVFTRNGVTTTSANREFFNAYLGGVLKVTVTDAAGNESIQSMDLGLAAVLDRPTWPDISVAQFREYLEAHTGPLQSLNTTQLVRLQAMLAAGTLGTVHPLTGIASLAEVENWYRAHRDDAGLVPQLSDALRKDMAYGLLAHIEDFDAERAQDTNALGGATLDMLSRWRASVSKAEADDGDALANFFGLLGLYIQSQPRVEATTVARAQSTTAASVEMRLVGEDYLPLLDESVRRLPSFVVTLLRGMGLTYFNSNLYLILTVIGVAAAVGLAIWGIIVATDNDNGREEDRNSNGDATTPPKVTDLKSISRADFQTRYVRTDPTLKTSEVNALGENTNGVLNLWDAVDLQRWMDWFTYDNGLRRLNASALNAMSSMAQTTPEHPALGTALTAVSSVRLAAWLAAHGLSALPEPGAPGTPIDSSRLTDWTLATVLGLQGGIAGLDVALRSTVMAGWMVAHVGQIAQLPDDMVSYLTVADVNQFDRLAGSAITQSQFKQWLRLHPPSADAVAPTADGVDCLSLEALRIFEPRLLGLDAADAGWRSQVVYAWISANMLTSLAQVPDTLVACLGVEQLNALAPATAAARLTEMSSPQWQRWLSNHPLGSQPALATDSSLVGLRASALLAGQNAILVTSWARTGLEPALVAWLRVRANATDGDEMHQLPTRFVERLSVASMNLLAGSPGGSVLAYLSNAQLDAWLYARRGFIDGTALASASVVQEFADRQWSPYDHFNTRWVVGWLREAGAERIGQLSPTAFARFVDVELFEDLQTTGALQALTSDQLAGWLLRWPDGLAELAADALVDLTPTIVAMVGTAGHSTVVEDPRGLAMDCLRRWLSAHEAKDLALWPTALFAIARVSDLNALTNDHWLATTDDQFRAWIAQNPSDGPGTGLAALEFGTVLAWHANPRLRALPGLAEAGWLSAWSLQHSGTGPNGRPALQELLEGMGSPAAAAAQMHEADLAVWARDPAFTQAAYLVAPLMAYLQGRAATHGGDPFAALFKLDSHGQVLPVLTAALLADAAHASVLADWLDRWVEPDRIDPNVPQDPTDHHLRQLSPSMLRAMGASLLNALSPAALAQISVSQWSDWRSAPGHHYGALRAYTINQMQSDQLGQMQIADWQAWLAQSGPPGDSERIAHLSGRAFACISVDALRGLSGTAALSDVPASHWEQWLVAHAQSWTGVPVRVLNALPAGVLEQTSAALWLAWTAADNSLSQLAPGHFAQAFTPTRLADMARSLLALGSTLDTLVSAEQWNAWLAQRSPVLLDAPTVNSLGGLLANWSAQHWLDWVNAGTAEQPHQLGALDPAALRAVPIAVWKTLATGLEGRLAKTVVNPLAQMNWQMWKSYFAIGGAGTGTWANMAAQLRPEWINAMGAQAGELDTSDWKQWLKQVGQEGFNALGADVVAASLRTLSDVRITGTDPMDLGSLLGGWASVAGHDLGQLGDALVRCMLTYAKGLELMRTLQSQGVLDQIDMAQWTQWMGHKVKFGGAERSVLARLDAPLLNALPASAWMAMELPQLIDWAQTGHRYADLSAAAWNTFLGKFFTDAGATDSMVLLYQLGTDGQRNALQKLCSADTEQTLFQALDARVLNAVAALAAYAPPDATPWERPVVSQWLAWVQQPLHALSQLGGVLVQGFSAADWHTIASFSTVQEPGLGASLLAQVTSEQWRAWLEGDGANADALTARFAALDLGVLNTWSAELLATVPQAAWSAWLALKPASTLAGARVVNAACGKGLELEAGWLGDWLAVDSGHQLRDLAAGVFNLLPPESFADLETAKLNTLAGSTLAGIDSERWAAWLSAHDTPTAHAELHAHVLHSLLQARPQAVAVVLDDWLQGLGEQTLAQKTQRFATLDAAVLQAQWDQLKASFGDEWMAALTAWGQQQPNQLDQLGSLLVIEPQPLQSLRDLITNLGASAQLSPEQWRILDARVQLNYGNGGGYVIFYTEAVLAAMPEAQRTMLAQQWLNDPEQATQQLPEWSAEQINLLPIEVLSALRQTRGWIGWVAERGTQALAAHVINAVGNTLWASLDTPDPDTGIARWADWLAVAGHSLEQFSAATLAHILGLDRARAGRVQDTIRAMDAAQWTEVAANADSDLSDLDAATVAGFDAGTLNALAPSALGQLSTAQWRAWRLAGGSLLDLSTTTLLAMQPSVLQSTIGGSSDRGSAQAFTATQWLALAEQRGLGSLGAQVTSQFSATLLNLLQQVGKTGVDATLDLTPAQWFAWKVLHAQSDGSVKASGLSTVLQTRLKTALSGADAVPQWSEYQFARNAFSTDAQRAQYDQWVVGQGDLAGMRDFVHAFTMLSDGLAAADVQALAGLLAQAKDASGARGVLLIVRFVHAAYPDFSLHELAQGLAQGSGPLGLDRVLDVLTQGAQEAGLDAAAFRAEWASLLDAAPAGLTRLAMVANVTNTLASGSQTATTKDSVLNIRDLTRTQGSLREALAMLKALPPQQGLSIFQEVTDDIVNASDEMKKFFDGQTKSSSLTIGVSFAYRHLLNFYQSGLERGNSVLKRMMAGLMRNTDSVVPQTPVPQTIEELVVEAQKRLPEAQGNSDLMKRMMKADFSYSNFGLRILGERIFSNRNLFEDQVASPGTIPQGENLVAALSQAVMERASYLSVLSSPKYRDDPAQPVSVPAVGDQPAYLIPAVGSDEFRSAKPQQLKQWAEYLFGAPQGAGYSDIQSDANGRLAKATTNRDEQIAAAQRIFATQYEEAKSAYVSALTGTYNDAKAKIHQEQMERTTHMDNQAAAQARSDYESARTKAQIKFERARDELSKQLDAQKNARRSQLLATPDASLSAPLTVLYQQWERGFNKFQLWAMRILPGGLSAAFERSPERARLVSDRAEELVRSEFLTRDNELNEKAQKLEIGGSSYADDMEAAESIFRSSTQRRTLDPADQLALETDLAQKLAELTEKLNNELEAGPIEQFKELSTTLSDNTKKAEEQLTRNRQDIQAELDRRSSDRLLGTIGEAAPLAPLDQLKLHAVLKGIQRNQAVADKLLFLRNGHQGARLLASLIFGLSESSAQWGRLSFTNDQDEALSMRRANAWASTASTLNMPFNLVLSTIANREKNRLAGDTQSNAFLDLMRDYFPYFTRSGWQKYQALSDKVETTNAAYWSCFESRTSGDGARVVTLRQRRANALPTAQDMATELTQAFAKLRSGQESNAYVFKRGNELRWGLMKNTPAFLNDASQAVASFYNWQYLMTKNDPEDFRSGGVYKTMAFGTILGNTGMAASDWILDGMATGAKASRTSMWINLVGNGHNLLFGLYTANCEIEERHRNGVTNEAEYNIEVAAFRVRVAVQTLEYGINLAAFTFGMMPQGLVVNALLLLTPVISLVTMAVLGPDVSGQRRATALRDYAKALGSAVDSDIYELLAQRADWSFVGSNIVGGFITSSEVARFYERHEIADNGNYIRRGAIERMQVVAQGKSLSDPGLDPGHPSPTDTRMVSALTSVATELDQRRFSYGELVFLMAVTQRFNIGSENYVDASGVFEFDYNPMQGAINQPFVTLDTEDMQANASGAWSGNGWAGNAASLPALTGSEQGVQGKWLGISNGMSRNVRGLATVIKPHIKNKNAPAVVLIGRGAGHVGNDYTGTIYVDARELPEGSLIVVVNPADNNIKIITNGTPDAPQTLLVDAKRKGAAGSDVPRPRARQVVQWSSEVGTDFMVNLDAFGSNLLLQGGKGNERLFGEANDLQYMYGGGDVTLTLSGSRNLMYVGVGANALLLGDASSLQISSDRVSARVGQFVSYGTGNSLDFGSNTMGLVFENYAGIVDIRKNSADVNVVESDQPLLAQVRGFASLHGTQGRDRYVVAGVQAGTQQAVNLFGGDGDDSFEINTSSGVAIALGAGGNTVRLSNALATSIETFAETATSAELFTTSVVYASSSIYMRDYSYLTATLRGVDSVFMTDETASEAILMVDGGIHTIALRGQELALYVDGTESSTTTVTNYLRDASGAALDTATRSELVDIQGRNDTRIAISYDAAARTLFLATFADDGSLLSEISLSGNVDDDMVLSYDTVARRAGNGVALGASVRSSVAASVLVDALAQADASAFTTMVDRQQNTRSMAWLYNIFAPA
jgi:hypothetical protein